MSESKKCRILSESTKKKMSIIKLGKKKTKETRKRMSIANYNRPARKPFTIDGVYYKNLREASEKLKIPMCTIGVRLKNKSLNFDNYQYL